MYAFYITIPLLSDLIPIKRFLPILLATLACFTGSLSYGMQRQQYPLHALNKPITTNYLCKLICDNNHQEIKRLQYAGRISADVINQPQQSSQTFPLEFAVIRIDNSKTVKRLLDMGADPNKGYGPPLWSAVECSALKSVKLLLQYGASIHPPNDHWSPILFYAAVRWRDGNDIPYKRVRLLINAGAQVDEINSRTGETALTRAFEFGNEDALQALLDSGALRFPLARYEDVVKFLLTFNDPELQQLLTSKNKTYQALLNQKDPDLLALLNRKGANRAPKTLADQFTYFTQHDGRTFEQHTTCYNAMLNMLNTAFDQRTQEVAAQCDTLTEEYQVKRDGACVTKTKFPQEIARMITSFLEPIKVGYHPTQS